MQPELTIDVNVDQNVLPNMHFILNSHRGHQKCQAINNKHLNKSTLFERKVMHRQATIFFLKNPFYLLLVQEEIYHTVYTKNKISKDYDTNIFSFFF